MIAIAVWYLTVQCLAAAGFTVGSRVCAGLPDRGYCTSKVLGVSAVGLLLWMGTATGLLRNGPGGAALAFLVVLALGLAWRFRADSPGELLDWMRRQRSLVIAAELVFLAAFAGWCVVRAHDPAADHTEEPMDLMLLVAVSSSDAFPPGDPWLAGYPISYYYLGYWLLGTLGHLAGTLPEVTYNLGQATWFGFLLLSSFGLAWNVAALAREPGPEPRREATPMRAGLIAAIVVGLTANLALPLEWLARWRAGTAAGIWSENWWWWRSSRVVRDVELDGESIEAITEFPFFSYLLGDNHPHLLAMPVVLLTLTLALALFVRRRRAPGEPADLAAGPFGPAAIAVIVGVAGAIAAINTWDVPAAWSILVFAAAAAATPPLPALRGAVKAALGWSAALVLGTVVLYLPYHLTASSQVRGVLPNLLHPTALDQVVVMFATLVPGVILLVGGGWDAASASRARALRLWLAILALAAAWLAAAWALAVWGGGWGEWVGSLGADARARLSGEVVDRWSTGWPTLVVVAGALAFTGEALWARLSTPGPRSRDGVAFALLLATGGLVMILVPELAYLHDSFGTRMNTVFKFWYQAWLLLALAGAVGIALAWRQRGRSRAAAVLGLLAIAPGFFYPAMALWTKTGGFGAEEPTLDALAWLERWRPQEIAAIRWLRRSTPPDALVVQRSGASYRPEHNLPSMVTGRPTLLGWGGHEYQWRGAAFGRFAAGREEALGSIYAPASEGELADVLAEWNVDYVYLGPEERARYGVTAEREGLLAGAMDLVFENEAVRIYRRGS